MWFDCVLYSACLWNGMLYTSSIKHIYSVESVVHTHSAVSCQVYNNNVSETQVMHTYVWTSSMSWQSIILFIHSQPHSLELRTQGYMTGIYWGASQDHTTCHFHTRCLSNLASFATGLLWHETCLGLLIRFFCPSKINQHLISHTYKNCIQVIVMVGWESRKRVFCFYPSFYHTVR